MPKATGEAQKPDRLEPIKYLTERLRTFADRKLIFSASPENLPLAREFLTELHKKRYGAESPLLVVDVEELFKAKGEEINAFSREDIYREALRQLDPASNPDEDNAFFDFQHKAEELERQDKRVGILMLNLDAVTEKFKELGAETWRKKLDHFLFSTFRVSGRFRLYGHLRLTDHQGVGASMRLNDSHFVWEEDGVPR